MGLGPPVCTKCRIFLHLQEGGHPPWYCPSCNTTLSGKKDPDHISNLWVLPIAEQKEYQENSTLFRFLTWQDKQHAPVNK